MDKETLFSESFKSMERYIFALDHNQLWEVPEIEMMDFFEEMKQRNLYEEFSEEYIYTV